LRGEAFGGAVTPRRTVARRGGKKRRQAAATWATCRTVCPDLVGVIVGLLIVVRMRVVVGAVADKDASSEPEPFEAFFSLQTA